MKIHGISIVSEKNQTFRKKIVFRPPGEEAAALEYAWIRHCVKTMQYANFHALGWFALILLCFGNLRMSLLRFRPNVAVLLRGRT
jgi:hypothetical protein